MDAYVSLFDQSVCRWLYLFHLNLHDVLVISLELFLEYLVNSVQSFLCYRTRQTLLLVRRHFALAGFKFITQILNHLLVTLLLSLNFHGNACDIFTFLLRWLFDFWLGAEIFFIVRIAIRAFYLSFGFNLYFRQLYSRFDCNFRLIEHIYRVLCDIKFILRVQKRLMVDEWS